VKRDLGHPKRGETAWKVATSDQKPQQMLRNCGARALLTSGVDGHGLWNGGKNTVVLQKRLKKGGETSNRRGSGPAHKLAIVTWAASAESREKKAKRGIRGVKSEWLSTTNGIHESE